MTPTTGLAEPAAPTRRTRLVPTPRLWAVATAVSALVAGLLPLLWNPRYFFRGDTQIAYTGWWYELGDHLLRGSIPLLDPASWSAGNYVAEGQWGLFSPLTWTIALGARLTPDILVFTTAVKIGFLVVGALGTYLLVRSYAVPPSAAYAAGVLVGLCGVSYVLDWPSWVNGQMATALLPWAWWLTRRVVRGAHPLPALLVAYAVVTIGYVYAALYLAVVIVGCLVDAGLQRDRRAFLRVLGVGVISGLAVITVYLPGILTAPVTIRAGWAVSWAGALAYRPDDLAVAILPATGAKYLLWMLPMLLWVDPRRLRSVVRPLAGALVCTALLGLWVLGPAQVGPLRWPLRVLPALMVPLALVVTVLLARCVRRPVAAWRVGLAVVWVALTGVVALVRGGMGWSAVVVSVVVVAVGMLLVAGLARRPGSPWLGAAGAWTVVVLVVQLALFPVPPSADRHLPGSAAAYTTQIPTARGDVMTIGGPDRDPGGGSPFAREPTLADDLLLAASWYRSPHAVQSGYTTIDFVPFRERFCRFYNFDTCKRALREVLARDATTGRRWVDLLSVSTLVLYRPDFSAKALDSPPSGWREAARTRWTVTWVRDDPLPPAGGVVWTSAGTTVTADQLEPRTVRLRVDAVPAGGGRIVLSRLPWPGYTVEGARLGSVVDEILLTLDVPAEAAGQTITLRWSPPGWGLELAALWLAIGSALLWSTAELLRRRRSGRLGGGREHDPSVEQPAGGAGEDQTDHVRGDVVGEDRVQPEPVPRDGQADRRDRERDPVDHQEADQLPSQ